MIEIVGGLRMYRLGYEGRTPTTSLRLETKEQAHKRAADLSLQRAFLDKPVDVLEVVDMDRVKKVGVFLNGELLE
jgi:hypothetical protein